MSRDLSVLDGGFRQQVTRLLDCCAERGAIYEPFFTLRDPFTQARFYRQSRVRAKIDAKIAWLEASGAPFLAECLRSVGPQPAGRWLTNALPGLSWHQHRLAVDLFRKHDVDGDGIADADWRPEMYKLLSEEAEKLGLTSLASLGDPVHIQYYSGYVMDTWSLPEIDHLMYVSYGSNMKDYLS